MLQTEHCAVGTKKNDEKSQIKWILSGKDFKKAKEKATRLLVSILGKGATAEWRTRN